jgi:hypothetical protein
LISWKIPAALFFIKPWLDRKIRGKKKREKSLGEKERKRQGGTKKLCQEKCFLARNKQEIREKRRNKGA